jgi:hypothetical protein
MEVGRVDCILFRNVSLELVEYVAYLGARERVYGLFCDVGYVSTSFFEHVRVLVRNIHIRSLGSTQDRTSTDIVEDHVRQSRTKNVKIKGAQTGDRPALLMKTMLVGRKRRSRR